MKRFWKRWLCVALVVTILAVFPLPTLGEEDVMEWTYDNSIVVTINTDTPQQFTPEDFPEINCKSVWVTEKSQDTQGFIYELILVLQDSGEKTVEEAINIMTQCDMVISAQRNEKFIERKSTVSLDHSLVYLKVGDTQEIAIKNVDLIEDSLQKIGIVFSVDDIDALGKDSLLECGISQFWPDTQIKEDILLEKPDSLEGQKSENGKYYGLISTSKTFYDVVHALSQLPEILSVSVVEKAVPGGETPYENWKVSNPELIELSLSGGEPVPGFGENGPRLNQKATIQGKEPGVALLEIERGGFGAHATACCTVIVYSPGAKDNPGDVNQDGSVDAKDALLVLQHSVELISLDAGCQPLANINGDSKIDAADALLILQISVGIIK